MVGARLEFECTNAFFHRVLLPSCNVCAIKGILGQQLMIECR